MKSSWLIAVLLALTSPLLAQTDTQTVRPGAMICGWYVVPAELVGRTVRCQVNGKLDSRGRWTMSGIQEVGPYFRIEAAPTWRNIIAGLELDRRTRWGELYGADTSRVRTIAGHDWLRTRFRYAYAPEKGDEPRIGHSVELATVDRIENGEPA